ncbi:MAG TPA: LptF/LptG family permease, partial [Verrucomicrobiae bacterium]
MQFIIANHRERRQHKTCPAAIAPNTLRVMRLLDRYLFRELFTPLAICLIGIQAFVIVFTVFTDAQKIQDAKLHFGETIEYATASAMDFVWVVLPIALLLALLITLTYYARHNEITAMRTAGISLWRICAPYFAVGLAASGVLFALNEYLAPRSAVWAERILHRYVASPDDAATHNGQHGVYFNARERRTWYYTEYHAKAAEMTGPNVGWFLPDGSWREISADRAVRTNGVWTFYSSANNVIELERTRQSVSEIRILATNVLAMPQFDETPGDIERDIRFSNYDRINSRKLNIPLTELWGYLRTHRADLQPSRASFYWTKFDGRLAAPWTCLVVVL